MGILFRLKALFWAWLGRAAPEQPEDPQLNLGRSPMPDSALASC